MANTGGGRPCTVCGHPDLAAIDQALVRGESNRGVAARFGLIYESVRRHKAEHIPEAIVKAQDIIDMTRADDLLEEVRDIQRKTQAILDSSNNDRVSLLAIREARSNIELLGRLLGQLQPPTINILIASPEWLNLRTKILRALEDFPEARLALADALSEAESVT